MNDVRTNFPLVSIIVPVYKVEAYLGKCIQSLLAQTYPNLEIILVDDGSPDNCPYMCDEFAKKYDNVVVYHKQNGGLGSARNYGVEKASADWITFVDSDDYVKPEYISYMWNLCKEYQADMVSCNVTPVNEEGKVLIKHCNVSVEQMSGKEAFFSIYFGGKNGHSSYSKLLRKSISLKCPFPNGYFEDFATTYKWLLLCDNVILADGAENYRYLQRDGSILNSNFNSKHMHAFDICNEISDFVDMHYPEYSKYKSILYQRQVIQMLNKQTMTKSQFEKIYLKYRGLFRKDFFYIVFSNNIDFRIKIYRVLLSVTPKLYLILRFERNKSFLKLQL